MSGRPSILRPRGIVVGGNITAAAVGSSTRLVATQTIVEWVRIYSLASNSSAIVIGASDVDATADSENGAIILAGENVYIEGPLDLTDVFFEKTTGVISEILSFLYLVSVS